MMHPDVEQIMRTGYPSPDYSEWEREQESESAERGFYDDFHDFFKGISFKGISLEEK